MSLGAMNAVAKGLRRCYASLRDSLSEEELHRLQTQLKSTRTALVLPDAGSISRASERVLAILVGWTASTLKPVVKHAHPYTKVGIPVVCVATSLFQVWSTNLSSKVTRSVLQSLDDSLDGSVSLVMHVFSSGPGVLLPLFISDFESRERKLTRKLNPTCIVFDSGPAQFTYDAGVAAARILYRNTPMFWAAFCAGVTVDTFVGRKKREEWTRVLQSPLLDLPQLYLYSEADTVAPPSQVREVMRDQEAMGREVSSHCWKDSQHVRHYVGDPDSYEQHIHTLLKKCQLI